jgi:hypothetical protein
MTLLTIMTSLSLALQMEHDLRDELWNFGSRLEHLHSILQWHHNICYFLAYTANLHFADNSERSDQDNGHDRSWQLWMIFNVLN